MHAITPFPAELELDELTRLQLHIARRADELSRAPASGESVRDCWLDAEREVWRAWFSSERSQLAC